ncbi:MAG: Abortive infection protein [Acidimicrobiales bacterium]|nr:Abortive infection protein [Acidimicrobiales bacterium]
MAAPVDQRVRWGMGDALAATAIGIAASAVIGGIALSIAGVQHSEDLALWALALLQVPLWLGLAGVPVYVSRHKGTGSLADDFGLRMRWVDVPVGLAAGLLSQLTFSVVAPPIYRAVGLNPDKISAASEKLAGKANDPFGVLCLFLLTVVGAALIEELCYRGLWLRSIERRFGTVAGVLLSALVFGVVHFELYALPLLAVFGVVLGVLAARTGRLGPAIWAHVAFNLTALVNLLR